MKDAPIRRCRHARHPRPMVDECAVGVDIEALCGKFGEFGRHYRLPCHDSTSPGIDKCACDKRDLFTDAEVADDALLAACKPKAVGGSC